MNKPFQTRMQEGCSEVFSVLQCHVHFTGKKYLSSIGNIKNWRFRVSARSKFLGFF